MKILILSIYNQTEYYDKMLELQKKYIHKKDNIDAYFIKYGNHDEEIIVEDNIISFKGQEGYMKITQKTIMALDYIINKQNKTYDYVIRTNVSTIINLDNLIDYLQQKPRENFYSGGYIWCHNWLDPACGITVENQKKYNLNNLIYVSGTSIIFSFDIAKYMIVNNHMIKHDIIDDVAFGLLIRDYKPEVYNSISSNKASFTFSKYHPESVFIRNRTSIHDLNRQHDIDIMTDIISIHFSN